MQSNRSVNSIFGTTFSSELDSFFRITGINRGNVQSLRGNHHLTINRSGRSGNDGRDGSEGSDGDSWNREGSPGTNGTSGSHGENGQPISIVLQSVPGTNKAIITHAKTIERDLFAIDSSTSISLISRGGNGGDGGDGGRGGKGMDGSQGAIGSRSPGGRGGDGYDGGNGGNGGSGGRGGDGGDITVNISEEDMDLCWMINSTDMSSGNPGRRGRGGDGGRGGSGGMGGPGDTWWEDVNDIEFYTVLHADGYSSHVETRTVKRVVTHYEPYGSNGSWGSYGYSGDDGRDGDHGQDGKFTYRITRTDGSSYTARTRYNLKFSSCEFGYSDDGIFEPGEEAWLSSITVVNNGGMPTPSFQAINVGINNNALITFVGPELSTYSVSSDRQLTLRQRSCPFKIKSSAESAKEEVFYKEAPLTFYAYVERIGKFFDNFHSSSSSVKLPIRYPVELSSSYAPSTILKGDELPFVIKARNISTQSLGG
ncbi:MAG: hypothetical protein ACE365_08240, partial [Gammaproteobacteria bacterium]